MKGTANKSNIIIQFLVSLCGSGRDNRVISSGLIQNEIEKNVCKRYEDNNCKIQLINQLIMKDVKNHVRTVVFTSFMIALPHPFNSRRIYEHA